MILVTVIKGGSGDIGDSDRVRVVILVTVIGDDSDSGEVVMVTGVTVT